MSHADFANRLRKNARHWGRWARRRGLEAYRVYDGDIPEYPYVVDIYGPRAHLQVFERDDIDAQWVEAAAATVADVLGMARADVAVKWRRRQKGSDQYRPREDADTAEFAVTEYGLRYLVNLNRYLDTGLFIDHRETRRIIRERASGRRFLNLYAYTGSFTVAAAAGGASASVTVDLSNTYLDWARRNLAANGLDGPRHAFVREDVFAWLDAAMAAGDRFELILLDPPSFSNSKRMRETLDVQRDHPRLINQCLALLEPGGELYFSTNRRRFRLYEDELRPCVVSEITDRTVPEDCARHRPHRCWLLRHEENT
jgi:23S rRNA (cytosine1962-C5)-methyltransferase